MLELVKLQRSRDRISERLAYLMSESSEDEKADESIIALRKSMEVIDGRIAELKRERSEVRD
jgi:hypothetical protein